MSFISKLKSFINSVGKALKGEYNDFWSYLKEVHSGNSEASAKRFYGGIGFLAGIILFYLVGFEVISKNTWIGLESAWDTLMYLSAGLIAGGTIQALFSRSNKFSKSSGGGQQNG